LERHFTVRAFAITRRAAGNRMAMITAMTATTTTSSVTVKPAAAAVRRPASR